MRNAAEADLARSIGVKRVFCRQHGNPPSCHKTVRLAGARPREQTLQTELPGPAAERSSASATAAPSYPPERAVRPLGERENHNATALGAGLRIGQPAQRR